MDNVLIAVVVPVYNGLDYTKKCLNDLQHKIHSDPACVNKIKVVLVDDGSTDGTALWVKKNFADVEVLEGNGNLWWSGGMNKGIEFSLNILNAQYVLMWNNDILAEERYFKNLCRIIKDQPNHVIIGSKIFFLQSNRLWGMGGKFDPKTGKKYMFGEGKEDNQAFSQPFEVDWFPGMGTCFHRSVFEKAGLLDEKNFPQYHGDSDFTLRAKKAGFKLIAFPELIIFNDKSNSGIVHQGSFRQLLKSFFSIKSNFNVKKNLLFLKKHATSPRAYLPLLRKYFRYTGGFFKWKFLNLFGKSKTPK